MWYLSVPIPTDQFLAVVQLLQKKGDARDPLSVIPVAVQEWLDKHGPSGESGSEPSGTVSGYQWQHVFLPAGTVLQTRFKGSCFYAEVVGNELVFQGQSISPNQWVNDRLGAYNRNAWKSCWIKRPGENTWTPADAHRWSRRGAGEHGARV
jgi:hypothetical protein